MPLRNGARLFPSASSSKNLSARKPSAAFRFEYDKHLINQFRLKQRENNGANGTNEEDEAFGRSSEARSDGIDAMDDGSLEIDIENAEHVNGVKNDAQRHQPSLPSPQPLSSPLLSVS